MQRLRREDKHTPRMRGSRIEVAKVVGSTEKSIIHSTRENFVSFVGDFWFWSDDCEISTTY
jgi:hypothetical protein